MSKKVRVRFAPSPTGGLHLGGVRTVLFNYLFAKQNGGDFIVRIEDTDQTRFVDGAEDYIFKTLDWCGMVPDESPLHGGPFAPYRQSERKANYRKFADQLVADGFAYYAFDTTADLEAMRTEYKTPENPSPQYNHSLREKMRNSISLSAQEVSDLLAAGTPHVVRIKMPLNETVSFNDMIRGEVSFNTAQVDDKVLLKADGMPTYHLAWEAEMPQWAHLPLILKPDGNGKLSKRDGDRLGFPVFAMDWTDPKTNETTVGFKEHGFLPAAFVNLLAMLGWNDGSDQEIFTMQELIATFSMDRVHKGGAKFDYEKAKWYNHEWIKKIPVAELVDPIKILFAQKNITINNNDLLAKVIELVKDRCTVLPDFISQSSFFFEMPATVDIAAVKPKWDDKKNMFFTELIRAYELSNQWESHDLEREFKELSAANDLKPGELMLPLRIMLVGGKFGPGVFDIAALIGKEDTCKRIKDFLSLMQHS
ncbi:MAG: glutamate--tRNA ligase family protein [Bacteroidetes bacterium]|nr:glutamate--tRNA ligase family protein [Bacteroidota bacterium]